MEDLDELRRFMRQMLNMRLQRENYDPHFGTAKEYFVEACRAIASDVASPRLARHSAAIVRWAPLASEVVPEAHAVEQTSHP